MLANENLKEIYYAGGCFWGVEEYFSRIHGVYDASVGYANGNIKSPTYDDVCTGESGYTETVHIIYNHNIISLKTLTEQFFTIINPISLNKQGNDFGSQYRTGIYFVQNEDKEILATVMTEIQKNYPVPLVVELLPLDNYYLAEEYHQNYLQKNVDGYCHINFANLKNIPTKQNKYLKPDDVKLQKILTPEEYYITQKAGTEPAFSGKLLNNKERGIYVDIVTGEPLFLSINKFDSGSGWPSFTKPINQEAIIEKEDNSLTLNRIEVRSRFGNSHLGHVFEDGPKNEGGLRYCINSASIRFIAYDDMEKKGYEEFKQFL